MRGLRFGTTRSSPLEGPRNTFEPTVTSEVGLFDEAEAIRRQLGSIAGVVDTLAIGPSVQISDAPRPVTEAELEKKAGAHGDDFLGMGCLPLMILTVVLFLVYGWALNTVEKDQLAFAFSVFASPVLASALLKLHDMRRRRINEGLVGQLVKIAFATVPVYFLL